MCFQRNLLGLGFAVALVTAITAPASAQNWVDINRGATYGVTQPPAVGNFIYGSPIPTPIPVNPVTGLTPNHSQNLYPQGYYSYPQGRYKIIDSTIVNPVLVNPQIRNSTLVNPVIVKDGPYHYSPYYRRVSPYHSPIRKQRVIITHPKTYPW
ncbi:hypothetical protein NUACC21_29360 [Scytonema sp. NUACC21]